MAISGVSQSLIQQGIEALRAGRPAEARVLCKRHLREHPGDPDVMHLWGVTEHYAGQNTHEGVSGVNWARTVQRSGRQHLVQFVRAPRSRSPKQVG